MKKLWVVYLDSMDGFDQDLDDEEFELPNAPAVRKDSNIDEAIPPEGQFEVEQFPITKELDALALDDTYDTILLKNEIKHMDMYINNIHSGFQYVTSVNSLLKLVGAGTTLLKERRKLYEQSRSTNRNRNDNLIEYDIMGNPIKKGS